MALLASNRPLQSTLNAQKPPTAPPSYPPPEIPSAPFTSASDIAIMADDQQSPSPSSSRNSLSSVPQPYTPGFLRRPILKSQYPADSHENHVEYILVASFDIDRGSVMEHQYPGPISGDETMLAELMLPDQAHVRSQDWTIFFLHKDTTAEEEAREERREQRRKRRRKKNDELNGAVNGHVTEEEEDEYADDLDDDDSEEDDLEPEGPPLIYVLNLVNTKQDQTVKRGAVCKAMAICTRHSFLHIYKPLLLLALEEYFRAPALETLASLYNAVNSMDLSLMPRLTPLERTILQASDAKDMFIEKFAIMIQQRMAADAQRTSQDSKESALSSPSRQGQKHQLPRDTHEFESRVLYNAIPVPIKVPVAITPETVGDFSLIKLITTFSTPHSTSPQAFATLHPHLTTSGPFTHPIIVLINALLTQKRIIFLGHNQPSGSVAEAVLAACALASGGILKGFTRHAFPYTDLTKIDDLLKVPGFIAGVTNPAFAHKPEWWDLLCDLPTGRMTISKRIEAAPLADGHAYFAQHGLPGLAAAAAAAAPAAQAHPPKHKDEKGSGAGGAAHDDATGDAAFMDSVTASIAARHGEAAVRTKFRGWVARFTRVAAALEEAVYGASALAIGAAETDSDAFGFGVAGHGLVWADERDRLREVAANASRVDAWRASRSYFSLVRDRARAWERAAAVRGLDLAFQLDRLRALRTGDAAAADIYLALDTAVRRAGVRPRDPDGGAAAVDDALLEHPEEREARLARRARARAHVVNQLLAVMPEASGGLFHLSLGLFHRDAAVRAAVVRVLEAIMEHEAGRHFWAGLGRFAKLAFFRVKREQEGKGLP